MQFQQADGIAACTDDNNFSYRHQWKRCTTLCDVQKQLKYE